MRVVYVSSVSHMFISVESEWFTQCVEEELGLIYHCYISEVAEECLEHSRYWEAMFS